MGAWGIGISHRCIRGNEGEGCDAGEREEQKREGRLVDVGKLMLNIR